MIGVSLEGSNECWIRVYAQAAANRDTSLCTRAKTQDGAWKGNVLSGVLTHVLQFGTFEKHEAAVILEAFVCGNERIEACAPEGLDRIRVELFDLHAGLGSVVVL